MEHAKAKKAKKMAEEGSSNLGRTDGNGEST